MFTKDQLKQLQQLFDQQTNDLRHELRQDLQYDIHAAITASELRLRLEIHSAIKASEQRMSKKIQLAVRASEQRLSNKIAKEAKDLGEMIGELMRRHDNHELRITTLENSRQAF